MHLNSKLRFGQDLEEGWSVFLQDQMGGRNMSAEPDSGGHLYAAAKAELNTRTLLLYRKCKFLTKVGRTGVFSTCLSSQSSSKYFSYVQ